MENVIRKPIVRQLLPNNFTTFKISAQKLIIKEKSTTQYLNKEKIVYCKSDSNYTNIHLADHSKVLCSKCLKLVNAQLSENYFYRIHASYLINLNYLTRIDNTLKQVVLNDEICLPIAKSRYQNLLTYLK